MRPPQFHIVHTAKSREDLDIGLASDGAHLNDLAQSYSLLSDAAMRKNLISVEWLMNNGVTIAGNGIGDVVFWARPESNWEVETSCRLLQLLLKLFESGKDFSAHPNLSLAHVQAAGGNASFFSGENSAELTKPNRLGITPAFYAAAHGHNLAVLQPGKLMIQAPTQSRLSLDDWRTRALYLFTAGEYLAAIDLETAINYWHEAWEILKRIPVDVRISSDKQRLCQCGFNLMSRIPDKEKKIKYFQDLKKVMMEGAYTNEDYHSKMGRMIENFCLAEPAITEGPDVEWALSLLEPPVNRNLKVSDAMFRFVANHPRSNTPNAACALKAIQNKTEEDISALVAVNRKLEDQELRETIRGLSTNTNEPYETYASAIERKSHLLKNLLRLDDKTGKEINQIVALLRELDNQYAERGIVSQSTTEGTTRGKRAVGAFKNIKSPMLRNTSLRDLAAVPCMASFRVEILEAIDPKMDEDYRKLIACYGPKDPKRIQCLEAISEKDIPIYKDLADLYYDAKDFRKIVPCALAGLSLCKENSFSVDFYRHLGWAYFKSGELEESVRYYTAFYNIHRATSPKFPDNFSESEMTHLFILLNTLFTLQKYPEALEIGLRLAPRLNEYFNGALLLGKIVLQNGDHVRANKYFSCAWKDLAKAQTWKENKNRDFQAIFEIGKLMPLSFDTWKPLIRHLKDSPIKAEVEEYFKELFYQSDKKSQEIILKIYNGTGLKESRILDLAASDAYYSSLYRQSSKIKHAETNVFANVALLHSGVLNDEQAKRNILTILNLENLQHYFRLFSTGDDVGIQVFDFLLSLLKKEELEKLRSDVLGLMSPEMLQHFFDLALVRNRRGIQAFDFLCEEPCERILSQRAQDSGTYALIYSAAYISAGLAPKNESKIFPENEEKKKDEQEEFVARNHRALEKLRIAMACDASKRVHKKSAEIFVSLALDGKFQKDFLDLGSKFILSTDQETFLRTLLSEIQKVPAHSELAAYCKIVLEMLGSSEEKTAGNSDLITRIEDFVNQKIPKDVAPSADVDALTPPADSALSNELAFVPPVEGFASSLDDLSSVSPGKVFAQPANADEICVDPSVESFVSPEKVLPSAPSEEDLPENSATASPVAGELSTNEKFAKYPTFFSSPLPVSPRENVVDAPRAESQKSTESKEGTDSAEITESAESADSSESSSPSSELERLKAQIKLLQHEKESLAKRLQQENAALREELRQEKEKSGALTEELRQGKVKNTDLEEKLQQEKEKNTALVALEKSRRIFLENARQAIEQELAEPSSNFSLKK